MPDDHDSLEPTLPAWSDVTESSPTIKERRRALVSSPQLGAKFKVLGYIGRGGMGTVFKVRHRKLDHVRAVKVLPAAASPEMIERLRREASIATDLTHPNIVTVYDLEELGDGSLAIVMEFLRGNDLDAHVKQHGRMEVREVRKLFAGVADAIDRMHAQGVVHRDIKPANLFLCEDGTLKVLDFGISRLVEGDSDLTRTGASIGTPSSMSPEQIEGEPASGLTDVYSLGAVLFYCLTGRKAFQARTQIELITKILNRGAPRADEVCPDVPLHVANAVERALAIEPEKRWASASQLLDAMASEQTQALEVRQAKRSDQRKWWLGGLTVAAAVALAVVAGVVGSSFRPEPAGETGVAAAVVGEEPVRGGTLRIGLSTRFPSLDPLIAKTLVFLPIEALIYDSLVDLDWRGEPSPALAESWEQHDGGRRFVFHLREDAILHDDPCLPDGKGHPVDAVDVQRTLERAFRSFIEDEDSTWGFLPPIEGFDEYLAGQAEHPSGITVVNARTVEVRFTLPAPWFIHCLNRPEWSVVAAEALDTYGDQDMGFHAVGSGPFRADTASDGGLTLLRHEAGWQRDAMDEALPYLDRIEVLTYSGSHNARTALKEGRVDILPRLPNDAFDVAVAVDWSTGRATLREGWEAYQTAGYLDEAYRSVLVLLFSLKTDEPYARDVRVRQAISVAIHRSDITSDPFNPTLSPLVDGMLGYEPALVEDGDIERAGTLLEEAGHPGGSGLPSLSLCTTDGLRQETDTIAEQLAEIGVAAEVHSVAYETWLTYLKKGGCDLIIAQFKELVLDDDPTPLILALASRAQLDTRHADSAEIFAQLRTAADRQERAELLRQLSQALVDDAVVVPLSFRSPGQPEFTTLAGPGVGGLADPKTGLQNPWGRRLRQLWKQAD